MNEWPIILVTVLCVAALGVGVFFWWRRRYGVWAQQARRSQAVSTRARVIRSDWGASAGAMGGGGESIPARHPGQPDITDGGGGGGDGGGGGGDGGGGD